jgi:hypothetical protein
LSLDDRTVHIHSEPFEGERFTLSDTDDSHFDAQRFTLSGSTVHNWCEPKEREEFLGEERIDSEDLRTDLAATRVDAAESEDRNFEVVGVETPALRVVNGGRRPSVKLKNGSSAPLASLANVPRGLWPSLVPQVELQDASPGERARAELRAKLANRGRKPDAVDNDHSQLPAHPGTSKATRREAM